MCVFAPRVAREERIELLRRQVLRRMRFGGLYGGWQAWRELWVARSFALNRLREIGNRLHKPELAFAFGAWGELLEEKLENGNHCRAVHNLNTLWAVS